MGINTNMGTNLTLNTLLTNHPIKEGEVQTWCAANSDPAAFSLGSVTSNEASGCLISITSGWYSGTDYTGTTFIVTNLGPHDTAYNLSFLTVSDGSVGPVTLESVS